MSEQWATEKAKNQGKGYAIAFAIVSIIFGVLSFLLFGWLTGFIAIFFGAVAVVKGDNWGYAGIVGIILGAIGVYGGLFGF